MSAWKIGSGDIDWHDQILKIAKFKKPLIIATGASNLKEVESIYKKVIKINKKLILMQCNTNYTANNENFKYINLNVLKTFRKKISKCNIRFIRPHIWTRNSFGSCNFGGKSC